jgi:hypothetical protein
MVSRPRYMCGACSHKILGTKELVRTILFLIYISSKTVVIFNYSSFLSKFHCHVLHIYARGHAASPFNASSSIYTSGRLDCSYLTMPRLDFFIIWIHGASCPAELVSRCCAPCSQCTKEHERSRCACSSSMHQIVSFVGIGGIWNYM